MIGPELLALLCECVACATGQCGMEGYPQDTVWVATLSVQRWFPGFPEAVQQQIVEQIMEALEHERVRTIN